MPVAVSIPADGRGGTVRAAAASDTGVEAEELPGWLGAIGSDAAVKVGAERDRAWCVRRVPDDDVAGWEVFWCEAGGRFEWTRFDDEDAACFYLFGRLAWAEALRGRRFG